MLNGISQNFYVKRNEQAFLQKAKQSGFQSGFTADESNKPLAKVSLDHLQANFLTFTSNKPPKRSFDLKEISYSYRSLDSKGLGTLIKAHNLALDNKSKYLDSAHYVLAYINDAIDALIEDKDNESNLLKTVKLRGTGLLEFDKSRSALFDKLVDAQTELKENFIPKLKEISPSNDDLELDICLVNAMNSAYQDSLDSNFNGISEGITSDTSVFLKILERKENKPLADFIMHLLQDIKHIDDKFSVDAKKHQETSQVDDKIDPNPLKPSPLFFMNEVKPVNILNFEHFENKAKTLGAIISGGQHAIYTHQKGAMPDLLAHSFTKLLIDDGSKGGFKDLNMQNTDVAVLDVNQTLAMGSDPLQALDNVIKSAEENNKNVEHKVIFIKGFDKLVSNLDTASRKNLILHPSIVLNSPKYNGKVHLIGFMNGTMYNTFTDTSSPMTSSLDVSLKDTLVNNFEKMNLGAPSPDKAKEMLLSEPRLLAPITMKYEQDIIFEPEAISKAVELAVKVRKGAMPGNAIELLNFITGIKANATGNTFESITADDVAKLSQLYPELKQTPESEGTKFSVIHDTGIRMTDVGGADQAKEVVDEILDFLKEPERFTKLGATMPKGVLLHGTPGNGKTYLAKAIAGEAGVPFISVSGSQFVEKYVGVGASRVRELFDFAREQARSNDQRTAIVFIDEFDAVGGARGGGGGGNREAEQTLNELLVQMDGLSNNSDVNVVVLAATNRPDLLDTALTERPGRFDHKIEVPNPARDPQARYEILKVHTKSKKLAAKTPEEKEAMLRELADKTSGASGARLADIVNKAAMVAARDNRDEITINDLIEAKLESSFGRVNKNFKEPGWSKEQTVAHECGHALTQQVMLDIAKEAYHKGNEIDTITLAPRGNFLGAVLSKPGENTTTSTFERVFADMVSCYGGYAVEKLHYGIAGSSGITQDLQQATDSAMKAVTQMGMGSTSRLISSAEDPFVKDLMKSEIKQDVVKMTSKAAMVSEMIINAHREFIEEYVADYKANSGKGGDNLSGESFTTKLHEWRAKNQDKFELLKKAIYLTIDEAKAR